MVIIGILTPALITVEVTNINQMLYNSIVYHNEFSLIYATFNLVLLNTIRAIPHYLGAFFIGEAISFKSESIPDYIIKSLVLITIIPLVYFMIYKIHDVRYHFGLPAITMIILIAFLGSRNYSYIKSYKKIFLIVLIILAIQLLDVMPALDIWPIGKGEISQEVKLISKYLDLDYVLNTIITFLFILLMSLGLIILLLVREENTLKSLNALREQNFKISSQAKIQELENRSLLEMRNLVHDLNSPLTSAQALVSLVNTNIDKDLYSDEKIYLDKVENSLTNMSHMIKELLFEDTSSNVTVEFLVNRILSNVSIYDFSDKVEAINKCPEVILNTNAVFFTRAIINLFQNSYDAIKNKDNGCILFYIEKIINDSKEYVEFSIIDNGSGIDHKYSDLIWDSGFSTKGTSGLGLTFVKHIIESNNGKVYATSNKGAGTSIIILMEVV